MPAARTKPAHRVPPAAHTKTGRPDWIAGAFRTLVVGQAVGQLGDGLTQIAFAQLVVFDIGRGATPVRIAATFAVTLLPFSVVGPVAGVLIDRWDRRRTLVVASLCRAALAAVAISAAVWRSEPLAYVGVVLLLSSSRFVLAAKSAVLPRTVPSAALVRANAFSALAGMAAAFLGALGGAMIVAWSDLGVFLAGAGAYLVASACFRRLPGVGGGGRDDRLAVALRQLGADLADGCAAIVRTPNLWKPLTTIWLHRLLLGGAFVLLVLVADRRYHLEASGYGLAIAVTGIAAVIGTVSAPSLARRWPARVLLPLSFLPPAAVLAAVGFGPTLAGLVCGVGVIAAAFQAVKIITDALVGRNAPDQVRGRVFAIYDLLYNVAFVVAGLAMIPLWRLTRERALLAWLAAAFVAGWLLTAWIFAGARRRMHAERMAVPGRWRLRGLSVLAGALVVVVFPALSLSWAAWFVLVPWLLVLRRAPSAREAGLRGFFAAAGFLVSVHYWLLPSTTVFLFVIVGVLATLWVPWSVLTWRLLCGELSVRRLLAATAVVPAGWVLVEIARSWSALGGPFGLLGASQWRSPLFVASASLGGVWLVSFLIVAVNVAVLAALQVAHWRTRLMALLAAVGLLAVGPLWFAIQSPPHGSRTARVAIVQAGVKHDPVRRLNTELAATEALPPGRYTLVVWGESSVGFDLTASPVVRQRLEAVAARLNTDLLANVDARSPAGAKQKSAVLLDGHGVVGRYEKIRLVPFGEYIPLRPLLGWLRDVTKAAAVNRLHGHRIVVMHAGRLRFAPLICFETAFPDMGRTAARQGAQLIVYQTATTTFQGSWAPEQLAALAAVRAVETGRPAIDASLAGTSAAFDAQGRRLLWRTRAAGSAVVDLRLASRDTPFVRYGDWVPAGCVLVVVAAAVAVLLRKPAHDEPDESSVMWRPGTASNP